MSNTTDSKKNKENKKKLERREKKERVIYNIDPVLNDYPVISYNLRISNPYVSSHTLADRKLIISFPPRYLKTPFPLYLMAQEVAKKARPHYKRAEVFRMRKGSAVPESGVLDPTVRNHFRMTFHHRRYPSEVKRITNEIEKVIKRYFAPLHSSAVNEKIQVDSSHFDICLYDKQEKGQRDGFFDCHRDSVRSDWKKNETMVPVTGIICISSQITGDTTAGATEVYSGYERHVFPQSTQPGMMLLFPARLIHSSREIEKVGDWKEILKFDVLIPWCNSNHDFRLQSGYSGIPAIWPIDGSMIDKRYPCMEHIRDIEKSVGTLNICVRYCGNKPPKYFSINPTHTVRTLREQIEGPTNVEGLIDCSRGKISLILAVLQRKKMMAFHSSIDGIIDYYHRRSLQRNPSYAEDWEELGKLSEGNKKRLTIYYVGGKKCAKCESYKKCEKKGTAFSKHHIKELYSTLKGETPLDWACKCVNCDVNSKYTAEIRLHCIFWGKHRRLPNKVVEIIGEFKRMPNKCSCPHKNLQQPLQLLPAPIQGCCCECKYCQTCPMIGNRMYTRFNHSFNWYDPRHYSDDDDYYYDDNDSGCNDG